MRFATCIGSLSCMNTTRQCPKCSFMLGNNSFCKISSYCVTFMIPLKHCILPTPAAKMHPQIIIFHLPCFTVLHKYYLFSASLQPRYAFSRHLQHQRILSCCILPHQTRLSSSTEPHSYLPAPWQILVFLIGWYLRYKASFCQQSLSNHIG